MEDLTWKRKHTEMSDSAKSTDEKQGSKLDSEPCADPQPETEIGSQSKIEPIVLSNMQDENPPLVEDVAIQEDEQLGAADPAEKPPAPELVSTPSESTIAAPVPVTRTRASPPPGERDSSDSDPDQDKGANLKRKLGDRMTSEQPVAERSTVGSVAGKRSRDDEDGVDANPRETKRPTPPPDEDEEEGKKGTKSPRKTSKERKPTSASATASSSATASTPKLVRRPWINLHNNGISRIFLIKK